MRTLVLLIMAATVCWPGIAECGLIEFTAYGTPTASYDATGLSMGMAGVAWSNEPILANPALLAESVGPAAQVTGAMGWYQQKRTREVFDTYANSVGLSTDLLNSNFRYSVNSISLGYVRRLPGLPPLGLGFGFAPEYEFNYSYHREIRDAFYYLTETRDISGSGQISRFTGILACKPLERLSVGAGISRLQGHQELRLEYIYTDPTAETYSRSNTFNYKGTRFDAGLWARPIDRLSLGISVRSSAKLTGTAFARLNDLYADTASVVTYPADYQFGISYKPANTYPATVVVEYRYTPWQRLVDNLNPHHHLVAVNRYSLGVSHRLFDQLPLSFSVSFANSYVNRGIGLAQVGLGTAVDVSLAKVAIGASVGRRSYNLGQATGTQDPTTVTETIADLMLTVSLR